MDVIILCGGLGTRLREETEFRPKPLVEIGGRPILWHIMKGLAGHGLNDFVLCLGYKSKVIKRYFLDYALANCDLTVQTQSAEAVHLQGAPLEDWHVTLAETGLETMTGARLKRVARYLEGGHFLVTYGDGVADVNLARLVEFHVRHSKVGTVTAVQPPGRFGEVELDGPRVLEFNEKPLLARGWVSGGFFAFRRSFLDRLPDGPDVVLEREPLIGLAREGQLQAHLHEGFWHCMDNSRDYQYLNDLWDRGAAPWDTWTAPRLRSAA